MTEPKTPAEIIAHVMKLARRRRELALRLVTPAEAAVRALKDAKLHETAAALESILFEIRAAEQESDATLLAVPDQERVAVLLEALK